MPGTQDPGVTEPSATESPANEEATGSPRATPAPATDQATQADVYTTSAGQAVPRTDIERMLKDYDEYKKGFQREYTRKRMAETGELKTLRDELQRHKGVSEQALALERHLRVNDPSLYKSFMDAMSKVRETGGSKDQTYETTDEPTPMPRAELPVKLQELLLREELNDFERETGLQLTAEQRKVVFEKQLELEQQLGTEVSTAVAAKYALFDLMRSKAGQASASPTVKPTLRGQSTSGGEPPRAKTADERRRELLEMFKP